MLVDSARIAMASQNLYAALRAGFPADMNLPAVQTETGLTYSWSDLDRGSAMMANLLTSLDLPSGARIAVQVDKSVEAMMLYLATLRAGYVFLPLNTAYKYAEVEYFVRDAAPSVVVCGTPHFGWVSKIAFQNGTHHVFTLNEDRTGSWLERAAGCDDRHTVADLSVDDLAAIIYTSGTTGRSKGAMLSHGNLLSNARVLHTYWQWRSDDVLIHALPIFHVHGLFVALHGALLSGSRMIWLGRFDAQNVMEYLPQATVFMGVPTMYVRLLAEPGLDRARASHMRLFISGSAPLLMDTFEQWHERTGHTILERYGMSETAMLTSNPCGQDERYGRYGCERRGGTVGFPLPGVSLRIRGADRHDCAADEIGDIEVKGPNVFRGYWRMPEKTAEEFTSDGYFKTGDVGKMDGQGFVTIVGRSKDLYISGGYNVYPAEIERYINELPGVAESAVAGVPHPDLGEVGVAVIVPRADARLDPKEILETLRSKLAYFKVPRHCALTTELPRNAMGKVQKNLLREQYGGLYQPPAL